MSAANFDANGRHRRAFSSCLPETGVYCWLCLGEGRYQLATGEIYDYDPDKAPPSAKVPKDAHYYSMAVCAECGPVWNTPYRRGLIMLLLPAYIGFYELCREGVLRDPRPLEGELKTLDAWFQHTLDINRRCLALYRSQHPVDEVASQRGADILQSGHARSVLEQGEAFLKELDDDLEPRRAMMERRRQAQAA